MNETQETWLYELITRDNAEGIAKIEVYMTTLGERDMTEEEQQNVALLLWKCLPEKAGFAQNLNTFLLDKIEARDEVKFRVPVYIQDAINHLIP